MDIVDDYIPAPERDLTGPFLMAAEGSFQLARGVVCSGRIERGTIKKGDLCEVIGKGKRIKSSIIGGSSFLLVYTPKIVIEILQIFNFDVIR